MAEQSAEISQRIEAHDRIIQEQQKSIKELKTLLVKAIENTQKTT